MSLFNLLSVSASGMGAQRTRAELLVENLANAETTRTAEGGPYRRRDAIFESQSQASPFSAVFAGAMAQPAAGVAVSEVVVDERDPELRYQPGHPDARPDGYVAYPRISPAEDMADLMGATRGYQANVSAFTATKEMIRRSLEMMR